MRVVWNGGRVLALGVAIVAAVPLIVSPADARSHGAAHAGKTHLARYARFGHGGGGLQCVPFARENTGIELAGNAGTWWNAAEGVYERGARPEVGSVLNFRSNGRMRMGHVAVVTRVADSRNIEIDHANWAGPGAVRGGVSRNISVVDVSERNDWSAVRVALGHSEDFGSVYPTYGFIYDRPDKGVMVANTATAPVPELNAAPRDLRPAADRYDVASAAQDEEEVAEAADEPSYRGGGRHFAGKHAHGGKTPFAKAGRAHGHGATVHAVRDSHVASRKSRHARI